MDSFSLVSEKKTVHPSHQFADVLFCSVLFCSVLVAMAIPIPIPITRNFFSPPVGGCVGGHNWDPSADILIDAIISVPVQPSSSAGKSYAIPLFTFSNTPPGREPIYTPLRHIIDCNLRASQFSRGRVSERRVDVRPCGTARSLICSIA
jgi:hypothetical protein